MQGSFKLGTIGGIEIRLHYTWIPAFILIASSLAVGYFPMSGQASGSLAYWILGAIAAVLLFVSVLLHELGHSFVARARGLRVDNITLFIFGGVSNITREPATAKDEFLISVVGPVVSLVLAGVFASIGQVLPVGSAASAIASYLASANLLLGLFNIVPGFPLDGGRVLRSIVWAVTGSMSRATRVASYVGQAIAFALIAVGVLQVLTGDLVGGLWTGFIGWFLNSGAEASRQQDAAENVLERVPVTRVMDASAGFLSPGVAVSEFVTEHVMGRNQRAMPVLDNGRLVGIVSITDAKHLDQAAWPSTSVADVMTRPPLRTLSTDASVAEAMQLMLETGLHQLPVLQDGILVGMVSRADVMRAMQSGLALVEDGGATKTRTIGAKPNAAPSHS